MAKPITPASERFWKYVEKTETCWIWTGPKSDGYGTLTRGGRGNGWIRSHRLSWEIHFGPIPEGKWVLHNCPEGDNRACVRPDHLFLGDHPSNMADMAKKGRWDVNGCRQASRGEAHGASKLTEQDVKAIRLLHSQGHTCQEISVRFRVTRANISSIVHRKTWRHVP